MKIFNFEFGFPKTERIYFSVTPKLLASFNNDIWELVEKTDKIPRKSTINGFLFISVVPSPDRIQVGYDPKTTSPSLIREWLVKEGIPIEEESI